LSDDAYNDDDDDDEDEDEEDERWSGYKIVVMPKKDTSLRTRIYYYVAIESSRLKIYNSFTLPCHRM